MIKVLYVGGKEVSIPELQGKNVHVDYVQNGMIALSAVQTSDFDAVIIENELPLMTPNRLIKELTQTGVGMPVIGLIRSDERRKGLLDDYEAGLFSLMSQGWRMVTSSLILLHQLNDFMILKRIVQGQPSGILLE